MMWIESGWRNIFPGSYDVAINTTWYNPTTDVAYESDILFNGEDYLWSDNGAANRYDVQNIATHEIGHSVGLDDLYGGGDTEKTMYGHASTGETTKSSLHSDDVNGARYVNFDPQLSGTLSENQEWMESLDYGTELVLTDNLTIPTNYSLTTAPSITVKIPSGKKITVNGILSTTGSSNNEITFEAQSSTWYGIEVNSTGHFNPTYCNFEDAQYPIKYYGSDGDVEHCDFTGYTRAVKYDNYSDSWITYSTFIEYGGTGIEYAQYSGGDIRSYNQIQDNYYGIKIDNTSSPDAGTYAGQGYNSIYNVMWDVYSTNASSISAQYNYWGGSDPSIYGNVTWEPALDEDPTLSKRFVRAAVEPETDVVMTWADTVGFKEFDRAHLLYLQGKTEQALALFRELTGRYPDYNVGRQSLAFEYRILRKEKRESESESRMLTVSEMYEGKEISVLARSIRVAQLLKDGDYSQAVSIAEDIVAKFPNTNLEKYSLYDLGTIHWYYLNDRHTGEKYYRQLIAEYPKDDLSISALATLGEWVPPDNDEKEQKNVGKLLVSDAVPEKYNLQQNYPNPFNPITTIEYDLPEDAQVTISIYNIQGQLVANLVNEHQKPGHHYITWHAGNQPSGMYLYKMETDDFSAVRKLMLIK